MPKTSGERPILEYDPDFKPSHGKNSFIDGFRDALINTARDTSSAIETETGAELVKKNPAPLIEEIVPSSIQDRIEFGSDSNEHENGYNLAENIIHRKVFETFYPMRDMQEEIDELMQPVKLDAVRKLHDSRIQEIRNDIRGLVKDWEEWDAYGTMLAETQSVGSLVDAIPGVTEEEIEHMKERAVAELDRDVDNLFAQVKKVKVTDPNSLEAPFMESEMNDQTDRFVEKYGLSREERERLIDHLANEFERESDVLVQETEPQSATEVESNVQRQDDEASLKALDEKFDEFLNRGKLGVIPPEPEMPGKEIARLKSDEPSDYGFRIQVGEPVDVVPEAAADYRKVKTNENLSSIREGLRHMGVLFAQGKSFAGEKLDKSMNWARDIWNGHEGLTQKQIVTRRVLGGVALLGLASGVAFLGYKLSEAAAGPDTGSIDFNGDDVGHDVPPLTEVEANEPTLPPAESFKDDHPWDWAVEAYGEENAMSELHRLSDEAARAGHTVQWHGSGANEWVEVDGNSNTVDVIRILRQYA
jgi:hypothetical protein